MFICGSYTSPSPNGDVISYIRDVDQRVTRLNTTLVKNMEEVGGKVDHLTTEVHRMEENLNKEISTIHKKLDGPRRSWAMQADNVCFGAKDNAYGKFKLKDEGRVLAVKLVYKSGRVSCDGRHYSHWGCFSDSTALTIYVTDNHNRVILPKTLIESKSENKVSYSLIGYVPNSPELVLTDYATSIYGTVGMEFRIWYSEDLFKVTPSDNVGITCTDVYVMFE